MKKHISLPIIISSLSLIVAISSVAFSIYSDRKIATNIEISSFDDKWIGGTFKCVAYLSNLEYKAKKSAYGGSSHQANEGSLKILKSCIPLEDKNIQKLIDDKKNTIRLVDSSIAYIVKEKVRNSFNALDLLISRKDQIDKCEMWDSIKSILERKETKDLIDDWRKHSPCGTDCFSNVRTMIGSGEIQNLNNSCS